MSDERRGQLAARRVAELHAAADEGRATRTGIKDELLWNAQVAVSESTDPDILILVANFVQPYHTVDSRARRLMDEARAKADRLGGPSELLERSGAAASDRHNRTLADGGATSGSGCAVAAVGIGAMSVSLGLVAARVLLRDRSRGVTAPLRDALR